MNRIEKSELLLALYAKQEEAKEVVKNAKTNLEHVYARGSEDTIGTIIQMITDDF